jgi:hypothetical protein
MMKGLFAYKSAYVNYTRACIKDFVEDNIQYAEVRPNFMTTNQLKTDDGSGMLNNEDIMRILDDGVKSTLAEIKQEGGYFAEWVFFEFLFLVPVCCRSLETSVPHICPITIVHSL